MFVAASTKCFPHLSNEETFEKLVDLQFSNVELVLSESDEIKPSEIIADCGNAIARCQQTRRLTVCSYFVDIAAEGDATCSFSPAAIMWSAAYNYAWGCRCCADRRHG